MTKKCNCWDNNSNKRCNKPSFIILKVQVFHPDSLRHSWQTWYACKEHYFEFKKTEGKEWGCKYRDNNKPFAPLVQYRIF